MKNAEQIISSKRDENSLYILTKRFVKLLWESPDHSVNISNAANMLGVVKRRVYDITNVLESINLITKWNVNSVKWIGGNAECIFDEKKHEETLSIFKKNKYDETSIFKENNFSKKGSLDISPIEQLEKDIDELNIELQTKSCDKTNLENAYVSFSDIKSIKSLEGKLLFAIKAPDETSIEYPKYEKGSYRMKVSTDKGQISVFYIENDK